MSDWYAHVTVATIVKRTVERKSGGTENEFLFVQEITEAGEKFNQPAGHLEKDESLYEAAVRETKEETGWDVELTGLVRVSQYTAPSNGVTYLRITLAAKPVFYDEKALLDEGIIGPHWLTLSEAKSLGDLLRSPLVTSDVEFYLANPLLPLETVNIEN